MQQRVTAQWTAAMQADYDLYVEEQITLLKQEDVYKALSAERQKAREVAYRDRYKVNTMPLDDFKKSDIYHKISEVDRKEIIDNAQRAGSRTVTILHFKNDQDAQEFAKKHGIKLVKIELLAKDPALNHQENSPPRPGFSR